jgi:hypothetical protein
MQTISQLVSVSLTGERGGKGGSSYSNSQTQQRDKHNQETDRQTDRCRRDKPQTRTSQPLSGGGGTKSKTNRWTQEIAESRTTKNRERHRHNTKHREETTKLHDTGESDKRQCVRGSVCV